MREGDLIGAGEEIANGGQIASRIGAAVGDLRCAVQRGAAADDESADGLIGVNPAGQIDGGAAVEEKCAARKAERGAIDDARRKDVRFGQADYLLPQTSCDEADGIRSRRMRVAVVDGVDGG